MAFLKQRYTMVSYGREAARSFSFQAPAREAAFDFNATVSLVRLSGGGRRQWTSAPDDADRVREQVRDTVRRTAKRYSIFKPNEAEEAVNDALSDLAEPEFGGGASAWTWRADAELDIPDEVKELRRNWVKQRYEIEEQAKVTRLRMEKLREISKVLEELQSEATLNWYAPYALSLADNPQKAADTLKRMVADRREEAENLVKLFSKVVDAQRSADVYELVIGSETALRHAFERLGVPLPPPDPDSLFVPPDWS